MQPTNKDLTDMQKLAIVKPICQVLVNQCESKVEKFLFSLADDLGIWRNDILHLFDCIKKNESNQV